MNHPQDNFEPSALTKELLRIQSLGQGEGIIWNALRNNHLHGIQDPDLDRIVHERIRQFRFDELSGRVPPFPVPKYTNGDLCLGEHVNGNAVLINSTTLRRGLQWTATTGHGKSVAQHFIIPQLAASGCKLLLLDLYKEHLRSLARIIMESGQRAAVVPWQDFKFNPLNPGGLDPAKHANRSSDILTRVLGLPQLSASYVNNDIYKLFEDFGLLQGLKKEWPAPTLIDLYNMYDRKRADINYSSRVTIKTRLGNLIAGAGRERVAYRRGWAAKDLLRFNIILELFGAPEAYKQLLVSSVIFTVLNYKLETGNQSNSLDYLVFGDDCQRFIQDYGNDVTPIGELASVCREFGIGVSFAFQSIKGTSPHLMSNLATKFLGLCGDAETFNHVGRDVGCSPKLLEQAKPYLTPGTFITSVAGGPPFLLKIPFIPTPPPLTAAEAAISRRELDAIPVEQATEQFGWTPSPHSSSGTAPQNPTPTHTLSIHERSFLQLVVDKPGLTVGDYSKKPSLNGRQAAKLRKRLVAANLIRERSISLKQRGRPSIILEPLQTAIEVLRQINNT